MNDSETIAERESRKRQVAVVGAGPAGLAAARRLSDVGMKVTIYERRSELGGTWTYEGAKGNFENLCSTYQNVTTRDEESESSQTAQKDASTLDDHELLAIYRKHAPPSASYNCLVNNIPTPLMEFEGQNYPDGTPWYVSRKEILQYLRDFARERGVDEMIQYNTSVTKIEKPRQYRRWRVSTSRLRFNRFIRKFETEFERKEYDFVIVCVGHYDYAYLPSIQGLDRIRENWPGNVIHSKYYRENERFRDQNVLVIGAGPSAFDLARDVAFSAKKVYQSVRQNTKMDPRPLSETIFERMRWSLLPENIERVPEISHFSLDPDSSPDISTCEIHFEDGTILRNVQHVIFCTGYRFHLPFLPQYIAPSLIPADNHQPLNPPIITDGTQLHNLYKDIFYIKDPTLAFIGVQYEVSTFPFLDIQSLFITSIFSTYSSLPSPSTMRNENIKRVENSPKGKAFHILGPKREEEYLRDLAEWIDTEEFWDVFEWWRSKLLKVREGRLGGFRELMLKTCKFRGKSKEDVGEIVEKKIIDIEMELERLKSIEN